MARRSGRSNRELNAKNNADDVAVEGSADQGTAQDAAEASCETNKAKDSPKDKNEHHAVGCEENPDVVSPGLGAKEKVKSKRKKGKGKKKSVPLLTQKELQATVDNLKKKIEDVQKSVRPYEETLAQLGAELVTAQGDRLNLSDYYEHELKFVDQSSQLLKEKVVDREKQMAEERIRYEEECQQLLKQYDDTKKRLVDIISSMDDQLATLSKYGFARNFNFDQLAELQCKSASRQTDMAKDAEPKGQTEQIVDSLIISCMQKGITRSDTIVDNQSKHNENLWAEVHHKGSLQIASEKKLKESEQFLKRIQLHHKIAFEASQSLERKINAQRMLVEHLDRRYEMMKLNSMQEN